MKVNAIRAPTGVKVISQEFYIVHVVDENSPIYGNAYKRITSNPVSCKHMYSVPLITVHAYLPFNGKCSVIICTVSLKEEESLTSETILCVSVLTLYTI